MSSGKFTTYRRASGSTIYGYVAAGDTVTVLGTSGSRTQIIYNVGSHYKMAWAETSQVSQYVTGSGTAEGVLTGPIQEVWTRREIRALLLRLLEQLMEELKKPMQEACSEKLQILLKLSPSVRLNSSMPERRHGIF